MGIIIGISKESVKFYISIPLLNYGNKKYIILFKSNPLALLILADKIIRFFSKTYS